MLLPLINSFFTILAVKLNDFENYRTETEYRNHLILKIFAFRFVNYFAALYYYAFLTGVHNGDKNRQHLHTDCHCQTQIRPDRNILPGTSHYNLGLSAPLQLRIALQEGNIS